MNLDLQFYWGLLLRRLPVMLALFMVCAISATVSALKMPPTYTTSARLLVEEPQIPDTMVRSVNQVDAGQQLQVIEQRLLTRANLLDIAREFNVFWSTREMTPDAIVARMRQKTQIRRTGGRRDQATLMTVSFEARSGQIAANVVNRYVTLILQESTEFRMSRAENTLAFFEQEVRRLGEDLDVQSGRIVEFKNANSDALPQDLTFRQNRQTLLQERQARLEREISALENQRRDMIALSEQGGQQIVQGAPMLTPEQEQLQQLQSQLQQALAVYSETNPRVVLLRNRITQLAGIVEQQTGNASGTAEPGETVTRPTSMFDLTIAEMEQRTESLRQELESTNEELDDLVRSIQATAGNAIELDALERDRENILLRYNEALQNLNQARMNERIEVTAQGQRVTVIENANVPSAPSGPKRFQLIAMGVGAGVGLAIGFFVLMELLNRTIRRPVELTSRFGITPLAVLPYMESRRERQIRRMAMVGAVLVVLVGVPAALWYVDTQYMPLDILANKVFTRLGLT
jgi:polysaccharide chain length determinant protein (PEP-CTERM system associated)